jgi:hypothetical protein
VALLHKASFILWFCTTAIHVLAYVPRLPGLLAAARRVMEVLGGRGTRLALLIASLLAGQVIALLTVHLAGKWHPVGAVATPGLHPYGAVPPPGASAPSAEDAAITIPARSSALLYP